MILSARLILLFLLSTVCLTLTWQSDSTAFFVFFAFVPLFFLLNDRRLAEHDKLLLYILTSLSVFLTVYFGVYWIRNVNPSTHFVIAILRGITMLLPYIAAYLFLFSRRITGTNRNEITEGISSTPPADSSATVSESTSSSTPIIVFIAVWMITEVLHDLNILGISYGNLGHVLAAYPGMIQWYAVTGYLGGTLWILLVNFALFMLLQPLLKGTLRRSGNSPPPANKRVWWLTNSTLFSLAILLPFIISLIMFRTPDTTTETDVRVIALHTSMDVYDYKYEVDPEVLLNEYINSSKEYLDSSTTNIIFWPENAVMGDLFTDSLENSAIIKKIRKELVTAKTPMEVMKVMVVAGAVIDRVTAPPDPGSYQPNILYEAQHDYHFKRYNAALFITSDDTPQVKFKKRLVPMSEQVPAKRIFSPLIALVPNLEEMNFSPAEEGYPFFSLGTENIRTTPNSPSIPNTPTTTNIRTTPIICYGSAFSTFTAGEVLHTGSHFLSILLNEGWMKSEKAYRHFNWFAICRAIENRRFMVKSSNEGITTLIDSKGKTTKQLSGTTSGAVTGNLEINEKQTFYTKFHRHIVYGILIAGFIVIIILGITTRRQNTKLKTDS